MLLTFLPSADRAAPLLPSHQPRWFLPAAVAASLALFWPTVFLGYLSDDHVLHAWAEMGQFLVPTHEFVRPVPLVLWKLVLGAGGGAVALHILNVLLHGTNAALTVILARRLGLDGPSALTAGLAFLVWPTQVEPVAWTSGVYDVAMTACVLGAVCLYHRAAPRLSTAKGTAVVVLGVLGLFSKETALALPVLLGIVAWPHWRKRGPGRSEVVTLGAVVAAWCAYVMWRVFLRATTVSAVWPVITRYTIKEQLSRCFGALAVPLSVDTLSAAWWLGACLAILAIVPFVWALVSSARREPEFTIGVQGLLWSLAATLPAMGYLYVDEHLLGSRYVYLSAVGWSVYLAVVLRQCLLGWHRTVLARLTIVVVLVAAVLPQTLWLLSDWRTAAGLRDRLLRQAMLAAETAGCSPGRVVDIPQVHRGAHLFENGFVEAVERAGWVADHPGLPPCTLRWNGTAFTVDPR